MKKVVIGMLGVELDKRTEKWRPTLSIFEHQKEFYIDRIELIYDSQFQNGKFNSIAKEVEEDISKLSPKTEIVFHKRKFEAPWEFEEVYDKMLTFTEEYNFEDKTEYFIHITTGTHVQQICWFLLIESNFIPAEILQSWHFIKNEKINHKISRISLDLKNYSKIHSRLEQEKISDENFLKDGIKTRNHKFNNLINEIEYVTSNSKEPILLLGPTGAGKTKLAKKIFELKKQKKLLNQNGNFIAVNCATLLASTAISELFGHVKGAFTGSNTPHSGLLEQANDGLLFLDEIAELGLKEQAMLLKALEEKEFRKLGGKKIIKSNFQLIAGTNKNLREEVRKGKFREDLLSRIDLWVYEIPSLKERKEDIEPNLQFEIEKIQKEANKKFTFQIDAKRTFLNFAKNAEWKANFRDLNGCLKRITTFANAQNCVINEKIINREIKRLNEKWSINLTQNEIELKKFLSQEKISELSLVEKTKLKTIIEVCLNSKTQKEAGEKLFGKPSKEIENYSDKLGKCLKTYGLKFASIKIISQN